MKRLAFTNMQMENRDKTPGLFFIQAQYLYKMSFLQVGKQVRGGSIKRTWEIDRQSIRSKLCWLVLCALIDCIPRRMVSLVLLL